MKHTSRIQQLFANDKAFIAYLTAGDGGIQRTLEAALALIKGGVNMLEIGLPFSDPIADGPIIQRACERALAEKISLQDILNLVRNIRQHSDIPLVLFSYYNPILAASRLNFFADAKNAGLDGLLLVDCPLEESASIRYQCHNNDMSLIYVVTPSTIIQRMQLINHHAEGFIYYACRSGTTGVRDQLPTDFQNNINTVKSIFHVPVVVGFGISNKTMVESVLTHADGVVIGSLFVKALEDGMTTPELTSLAKSIYPQPFRIEN